MKHVELLDGSKVTLVAPRAGAWIETLECQANPGYTYVAPRAGAWIETRITGNTHAALMSPPARGRGLKPLPHSPYWTLAYVAPRAGAWIETDVRIPLHRVGRVAPRAGAWIETNRYCWSLASSATSPPARGRGLKQYSLPG